MAVSKVFNVVDDLPNNSHWTWDENRNGKPIVYVDFDHTITQNCSICSGRPLTEENVSFQENVKWAMRRLDMTYNIIVFTGRLKLHFDIIKNVLTHAGIPFSAIEQKAHNACFIIDDRAVHHKDWGATIDDIESRQKRVETHSFNCSVCGNPMVLTESGILRCNDCLEEIYDGVTPGTVLLCRRCTPSAKAVHFHKVGHGLIETCCGKCCRRKSDNGTDCKNI